MRQNRVRRAAFAVAFALFTLCGATSASAATYSWNVAGGGIWTTATNWSPNGTPGAGDSVVFSNGSTGTITAVPVGITMATLQVSANTAVTLQPAAAGTLTFNGGAGAFSVASGSSLNISGGTALVVALATGSTGTVGGSMLFSGAAHKLTAVDASSITFQNGATFTSGTGMSGNVFGTTALNSVVFASGSMYVNIAGANPFGAGQPNSVVVFQAGSTFRQQGSSAPAFSGRTYANFEMTTGTVGPTGGSPVSIDNLTMTGGTLNWGMTGTASAIKGNITVATGATLNFAPATIGSVVNLSGSAPQTITNSGTLTFNSANETVNVNNAGGIILGSNVTITAGGLTLTNGTISTGANTLAIGSAVTVNRTSGYVIGNLRKTYAATGSKIFEVGTANGYSPVTANVTGGTTPADLTVSATQSVHPNVGPTTSLLRYRTLR